MKKPIKIPYGVSNFEDLVIQDYFFVDKSDYIEKIEVLGEKYIFFLRPRRFGKSLFVSMLAYYYDLCYKDRFDELFGQWYIGQNPTPKANQYAILKFNFSGIDTKTEESTHQGFLRNVQSGILRFVSDYGYISEEEKERLAQQNAPNILLGIFFDLYKDIPFKMYILVDEYDHFTNELLAFNLLYFKQIVSQNGYVRKFYEVIKNATAEGLVDRLFVTGVTPITLDSLTSGFNIASNLSTDPDFNEMMGFTQEEVTKLLKDTVPDAPQSLKELNEMLRNWYNGYLFSTEATTRLYNAEMVLYFVNKYQRLKSYPKEMLDVNVASDYGKIRKLFQLQNPEKNYEILQKLVDEKQVSGSLIAQFNFEREFDYNDFVSLLFYMGYVTFGKESMGLIDQFTIPNYVIEKLFLDYFIYLLQERETVPLQIPEVQSAMIQLSKYGNIAPFFTIIQNILEHLSNRDYQKFDEKYVQLLIVAVALMNEVYFIPTEREVRNGYVDILFLERPPFKLNFGYVFELKYLPVTQKNKLTKTQTEAEKQLKNYLQKEAFLQSKTHLQAYTLVVVKDKIHWKKVEA